MPKEKPRGFGAVRIALQQEPSESVAKQYSDRFNLGKFGTSIRYSTVIFGKLLENSAGDVISSSLRSGLVPTLRRKFPSSS